MSDEDIKRKDLLLLQEQKDYWWRKYEAVCNAQQMASSSAEMVRKSLTWLDQSVYNKEVQKNEILTYIQHLEEQMKSRKAMH